MSQHLLISPRRHPHLQQPEDVCPAGVGGAEAAEVVRPLGQRPPDGLAEAAVGAGRQDQGLDGDLKDTL